MATGTDQLEQRVSEIERELAKLKAVILREGKDPWWRQILGEFAGDEDYAEIARLGQELRKAERPE